MSHITDVKMKVRDLDALDDACKELGLELRRDKKTYAWWGHFVGDSNQFGNHKVEDFGKCEHAIGIPGVKPSNGSSGNWEIGVVKALDGDGYELLLDTYGGPGQALLAKAGTNLNRLRQEYSIAQSSRKAKAALSKKGFVLSRESLGAGRVRLRLRKR